MRYNFVWDPVKAKTNARKHHVSFEKASAVFNDPLAITLFDEKNSTIDEDRWITLGCVNGNHYLVVVHTYKNENGLTATIRVISARTASKNEIQQYQIG